MTHALGLEWNNMVTLIPDFSTGPDAVVGLEVNNPCAGRPVSDTLSTDREGGRGPERCNSTDRFPDIGNPNFSGYLSRS
jgi:hypothetical protein